MILKFLDLFSEFRAPSWDTWKRHLAHLTEAVREMYVVAGRGCGKSRIAAALAVYFATQRTYLTVPGERIWIAVIAPDREQATQTLNYVRGMLQSLPALAALIESETADSILLANNVGISVVTASLKAPRGRSYACAIIEEAAYLPADDAANPDEEIIAAVLPGLGRVPGSLLCVISSPYRRSGVLYDAFEQYHDGAPSDVLFIHAPTLELNPTFDRRAIDRMREKDPSRAAAEYDAVFRADLESLFTIERLDAVTPRGLFEVSTGCANVRAFVDPSGGSSDSFTLGIAGTDGQGLQILMLTREWPAPFSPSEVVAEIVGIVRSYGLDTVTGDAYSGEFVRELFRQRDVRYEPSKKNRSGIYLDGLALINSQRCRLLDDPKLRTQLLNLERRVGRTSDTIDHRAGAHDDVANAAIGALVTGVAGKETEEQYLTRKYPELNDKRVNPNAGTCTWGGPKYGSWFSTPRF